MDLISLLSTVVTHARHLLAIAKEVKENHAESQEVAGKIERLLPLLDSCSAWPECHSILLVLGEIIEETTQFLTKFVPKSSKVWDKVKQVAWTVLSREQISKTFEGINLNLDRIILELTAHQNSGLAHQMKDLLQMSRHVAETLREVSMSHWGRLSGAC